MLKTPTIASAFNHTKSMAWVKVDITDKHITLNCIANDIVAMLPLQAAQLTCEYIVANYPPPYNLMVSGGIDSQAMIYAWMQSGFDFNVVAFRYNGDMNAHDLDQLSEFAQKHNIAVEYHDLDLLYFLEHEYHNYAVTYHCTSPHICTHMKMTESVDGTAIFSGNFIQNRAVFVTDALLGLARYADQTNKAIVPFYFLETPELAYSLQPIHNKFTYNAETGYAVKVQAYQAAGFPVIPQAEKYTGFEKVKDYYDIHYKDRVKVTTRIEFAKKPSKRVFDLLLRYPYEKLLGERLVQVLTNESSSS
jgi:hypothetical protein